MKWLIIGIIAVAVVSVPGIAWFRATMLPKLRGSSGERKVTRKLGKTIPGEQYIINDLLFRAKNGSTCQIDHIYINKYGIWVIETKNYTGRIYGNENQGEWIQVLAGGNVKNKFYNPLKQNETHIYHLSQIIKSPKLFRNIVCFTSRADITNVKCANVYELRYIKDIKNPDIKELLSAEEMELFYNELTELKETSDVTMKEHIKNIHNMQSGIRDFRCPRCGGELIPVKGKFGEFYGCSNYPKCKFTKKK